jgi:hypothetical protein
MTKDMDRRGGVSAVCPEVPGIVIADVVRGDPAAPRIAAFIWGGKVRPTPTLPYGRWRSLV